MFKLQPKPTFKVEVLIPVPGGDSGKLTFEFKHKGRKDLQAYYEGLSEGASSGRTDADALCELIAGWEGIDAEFSEDNLGTLLDNYPGAAAALFEAYRLGLTEGRRKNSSK